MHLTTLAYPLALLSLSGLSACSNVDQSALVLDVTTEASPGVSLDQIHITVEGNGVVKLDNMYAISGANALTLPGTLTITKAPSTDVGTPVTVTVEGLDAAGKVKVTRSATLPFVSGKQKLLRIPLQFACFDVSCEGGQTCKQGLCAADVVDPAALPEYADTQVATNRVGGTCFDRDKCMQGADDFGPGAVSSPDPNLNGVDVPTLVAAHMVDLANPTAAPTSPLQFDKDGSHQELPTKCSLPNLAMGHDQTLNMGTFWSYEQTHWVAVDFDTDEGWSFSSDKSRVILAPGLCNELHKPAPRIAKLITYSGSNGCAQKLPTQPECADTGAGSGGAGGAPQTGTDGGAGVGAGPDGSVDAGAGHAGGDPGLDASTDGAPGKLAIRVCSS